MMISTRALIFSALLLWACITYWFLLTHDAASLLVVHEALSSKIREGISGGRQGGGQFNLEDDYDDIRAVRVDDDGSELRMSSTNYSSSSRSASSSSTSPSSCTKVPKTECDMYWYVRYWKRKFESKDCFRSPAAHPSGLGAPLEERKYVLFQPDAGGWNNIRMAAETVMVFAHASGRILVLPPKDHMYLLNADPDTQDNLLTFDDFLNMRGLREVLDVITMEEFLKDAAMKGLLKEPWKKEYGHSGKAFWDYIEKATFTRHWEPGKFHIGFNISGPSDFGTFRSKKEDKRQQLHASHNRQLIHYDEEMHSHRAIFFPGDYRIKYRILTHFYSYLYFAQSRQERQYKRLVRDRIRYNDGIFCAAGRVVRLLHEEAAKLSARAGKTGRDSVPNERTDSHPVSGGGDVERGSTYFAYHIRRGDFQYLATRQSGDTIFNDTKHLLDRGVSRLVFISTDEKKRKQEFAPFKGGVDAATQHPRYTVRFLSDYVEKAQLGHEHLSPNQWGMVEQLICAQAHTFFGTPLSTFSGFITRLRGYYRDDRYANTFYWMPESMYVLHRRTELKGPFWSREFAVAHADIDDDGPMRGNYGSVKRRKRHRQELLQRYARDMDYIVRDSYKNEKKKKKGGT